MTSLNLFVHIIAGVHHHAHWHFGADKRVLRII